MPRQSTGGRRTDDALWLMLGEIRSDLKWLVEERRTASRRMDEFEKLASAKFAGHDTRLRSLESYRVKVAAYTGILAVFVPSTVTALFKYLGVI